MSRTVIAVVSDLHAGSTVAVCPPRIDLDDGGHYGASAGQLWLWECWHDFWERVEKARGGDPLYVVLNGDIVDGDHHNTPQILSRNPNAQAAVTEAVLGVMLGLRPDRLFVVRGTESHVGSAGSSEEAIAKGLKDRAPLVKCSDTDTHSWWHLRMLVEGVRLDFAHHGRMGRLPWTKAGIIQRDAAQIFYEHAKRGEPHPDVAVRSHNHQVADSYDAHPTRLVATPAWQLATAYVHKVAPNTLADIGGLILTLEGGRVEVDKVLYEPERGGVWQPAA